MKNKWDSEQVVASVRDLLQRETNARILERSIDFLSRNKGLMALEGRLVELAADDNLAFKAGFARTRSLLQRCSSAF